MTISDRKRLNIKTEAPEGVDAREFRMAENIYVLYALSREERREYLVKLQAKNVDAVTVAAIASVIFNMEVPQAQEVSSEQAVI